MGTQVHELHIDSLRVAANNPRSHSPTQIREIAKSITRFGFTVPLLVDAQNEIIAGHGRLLAAKQLEMTHVPVIRLDQLTPEQARAYRIVDNRLTDLGAWDVDALRIEIQGVGLDFDMPGFTSDELLRICDLPTESDLRIPDPAPPLPVAASGLAPVSDPEAPEQETPVPIPVPPVDNTTPQTGDRVETAITCPSCGHVISIELP